VDRATPSLGVVARITVVGAGYVGLVTAAGFAHLGHEVTCVDTDTEKIAALNSGVVPIYEAGLQDLVAEAVHATPSRLRFQVTHDDDSFESTVYVLCVPTPLGEDGGADVSYVEAAVSDLAQGMPTDSIVVNKSTVPVGSKTLVERLLGRDDVVVVSNPEFLREGTAVQDFLHPDRIVIGADSSDDAERVKQLYQGIDTPFVLTGPASAELVKYAANAFLATKLSFVNAVAAVCEGYGADIADVRRGVGLDQRIGLDFFAPGPGWGGSCFPKDTEVMLQIAEHAGYDFALVRAAIETNEQQLDRVAARVLSALDRPAAEATVGLLGLAFKAETDDIRMSPALAVADRLRRSGVAAIHAYDPQATLGDAAPGVVQVGSALEACRDADVVLIATEWPEFAELDLAAVATVMTGTALVDSRGVVDRLLAERAGLQLFEFGFSGAQDR